MHALNVGVFGATGYTGLELTRLLARHPGVAVRFLTSDRQVGQRAAFAPALSYVSVEQGRELATSCDAVFLATPAPVSIDLVGRLHEQTRIIDLSGAFRLTDAAQYPSHYGFEHRLHHLVPQFGYGLPELFDRQALAARRLIANPGCYATAAALSIAPALKAGLVEPTSLVVNAGSGVSGAGRQASEEYSFMEVADDVRAYKVLKHQHGPEITQTLAAVSGQRVELVFTPHLLPLKRGILCTTVATLKPGTSAEAVRTAYADAYASEPLMQLLDSADAVRLSRVVHTPNCAVGVAVDGRHLVAVSALDNLLKGAASQAVQNLNLITHQTETVSL